MSTAWHEEVKARNRKEIIKAGQELFLKYDLPGVSLNEICRKAGISRVTFYKYFASTDELAFEVQINVLSELREYIHQHEINRGSGYEQLKNIFQVWLSFAQKHPNHFKYIGFFDHYYRERYPNEELAERYRHFLMTGREDYFSLDHILKLGMSDGTIRTNVDVNILISTIYNLKMSLLQRLTSRGDIIRQEHGIPMEPLVETLFDMILHYVKK